MLKERWLLAIGLVLIFLVLAGLPPSWKNFFILICSLGIISLSYFYRKEKKKIWPIEKKMEVYTENRDFNRGQESPNQELLNDGQK